MVNWGITHVFGMVGHSNLGLADALRRQEKQGKLTFIGSGKGINSASLFAGINLSRDILAARRCWVSGFRF